MSPCLTTRRCAHLSLPAIATALAILLMAAVVLSPPAEAASQRSQNRYLVRRGDTLSDIALAHHTSVANLARANGIGNPELIYAGTWLVIPAGQGGSASASAGRYTVRFGDTLSAIALRYGLSSQALAQANAIADPDLVLAGTTLSIPLLTSRSSTSSTSQQATTGAGSGLPASLRAHPERLKLAPLFDRWAAAYGVPVDLLKSLAWTESGWQAGVVSPSGAIGVTQLMPATADFVARDLIGVALNPWVASDNIRMGARYLRYLLDLSGGRVATAVAAYYQGFASVMAHGLYNDTVAYQQGILAQRSRFA